MAIFIKPIDKGIPAISRRQVVLSSEVSTTDIIDVYSTLGNSAASKIHITTSAGSDLSVRYNVIQMLYPKREIADGFGTAADLPYSHLGNGEQHIDQTMSSHTIAASTEHLEETGPIKSIEVTWTSGTWSIELVG